MRLSVIILNWNTKELLGRCLMSLRAALDAASPLASRVSINRFFPLHSLLPPSSHSFSETASGLTLDDCEVLVVDNGSDDGSPEMVRADYPWARLLETGANLGFAGGNNVGLKAARGMYRMLLNSDTEVGVGALDILVDALDRNPRAGAVGGQLIYPDGRRQPSGSTFITLQNLLSEQLLLDKLFPRSRLFASHFLDEWHYRRQRRLDVLSGACLMIRAKCLEEVGLLDSRFFMYCEDVDWCLRAHRAGWDRLFVPEARIVHHHGASSRRIRPRMVAIYNESRCHYFRKHFGVEEARTARRTMTAGALLRSALHRGRALRGGSVGTEAKVEAEQWGEIAARTAKIRIESVSEPTLEEIL